MSKEQKFRYFSCVEGRIVPRFGTRVFIGVTRDANGFTWNTDEIVAIPVSETAHFHREYVRNVQKEKNLIEHTEKDYKKYIKKIEKQSAKEAEDRKKAKEAEDRKKAKEAKNTDAAPNENGDEPAGNPSNENANGEG